MGLNLPPFDMRTRATADGEVQVYDRLRRKYVALTPEEFVRQHFVEHLIIDHGYPEGLMANEIGITLNGTRRRCDTVVFGHDGRPVMIIEYKAPSIDITQKVFDQIVRYNMVLHTRFLVISNGLTHYCCEVNPDYRGYRFLDGIPAYTYVEAHTALSEENQK